MLGRLSERAKMARLAGLWHDATPVLTQRSLVQMLSLRLSH